MRSLFDSKTKSGTALVVTTDAPAAGADQLEGWAFNAAGEWHVTTDAVTSAAVRREGLAFTNGALHVVDSAPDATSVYREGF